MASFLDTGLLIKIYVNEPDSVQALSLVQSLTGPLIFTRFQRAETVNTLRCKQGRGELTDADVAKVLADIRADLRSGFLVLREPDWAGSLPARCAFPNSMQPKHFAARWMPSTWQSRFSFVPWSLPQKMRDRRHWRGLLRVLMP